MDNQQVEAKLEEEYGEKCNIFENTLNKSQQERFYKLETLICSLSPDQKKQFFELMNISYKIYKI